MDAPLVEHANNDLRINRKKVCITQFSHDISKHRWMAEVKLMRRNKDYGKQKVLKIQS